MDSLRDANIVLERPEGMDMETYRTYRALQNKALKQRIRNGVAFLPAKKYAELQKKFKNK